jgi:hypothetical protein
MKMRYTEEQILKNLAETDQRKPVNALLREHGV